jgi:copper chaperone CopZ
MIRKTFSVPSIHCTACVMQLEALEDELPGIEFIEASYQKQRLVVEFDEDLVSEAEIRLAVEALDYRFDD